MNEPFWELNSVKITDRGVELTEHQKELALYMARIRLLEDTAICERLKQLQLECGKQVMDWVVECHNLKSQTLKTYLSL